MSIFPLLSFAFPALFFSLVTYYLNDEIFLSWRKFSITWAVITVVPYFLVSGVNEGGGGGLGFGFSEKGLLYLASFFLYIVISFLLIAIKAIVLHFKKKPILSR